jgi:protoporphyrinogen oxidase
MFLRVASTLEDRIRYGAQAVGLDVRRKRVLLADGSDEGYDQLITTVPVDKLVQSIPDAPSDVLEATKLLHHSGSAIVGVGIAQPSPTTKCWMYFPEENCPYYRVTYLSNYSPEVVPDATRQYSLLAEVSRSPYKPINLDTVVEEVLDGFVNTKLLSPDDRKDVVDTHLITREYTYPIPTIRRDDALSVIQPWLEARDVYSRGRFGAWKYEIGNMDHSVTMGAEIADRLVRGTPELCWNDKILPKTEQTLHLTPDAPRPGASRRVSVPA